MKIFLKYILPPTILFGLFVGFWYLVALVFIPDRVSFLLPPPHEVLQEGVLEADAFKQTLTGLWESAQIALWGFGFAIILGIGIAILMSQARWIERTLFPYAVTIQAVPIVAIVPLVGLWFGYETTSKIIVTIIISIFPIITNTLFGLLSIDTGVNDLFRLHSSTNRAQARFHRITKLQFKNAIPSIFVGLKISAGLAVVGTIVAEFFFRAGAAKGLGRLIIETYKPQSGKAPELYTAIIITCLLGLALFWLVGFCEKYFTKNFYKKGAKSTS